MILRDLSAGSLTRAIEWNLCGLYATFARIPQARVEHGPDMMRVITGLPHELLNGIFRPRLREDGIGTAIDEAMEEFRALELPMMWWTGPSTRPLHLGKYLENCGLAHVGDLIGMAADLHALNELPSPSGLSVRPVQDEATLRTWLAPFAFGFELPESAALALFDLFLGFGQDSPFRQYLGRWKGHPVATSSLFLGAGVAGTYTTVVPLYRGQGIGAAMTLAPLREARAMGYRVGVTAVYEGAQGLLRKLGFKAHARLGLYMPRDQLH